MDDNEYKLMLLGAVKDIINLKIDNQVIINILINKNITTSDEIRKCREIIGQYYLKQLYQIDSLMESVTKDTQFESILEHQLNKGIIPTEELKRTIGDYLNNLKEDIKINPEDEE